jgi:hypothetical protein
MSETYRSRELHAADRDAIARLLAGGSTTDTLLIARALQGGDNFPGWWYGTVGPDGELAAAMAIDNHVGHLYAANDEAANAMGRAMLRQQQMLTSRGASRHELNGPWQALTAFWRSFQAIDRQLKADVSRELIRSTGSTSTRSRRISVNVADESDLRLVAEFTALACVEDKGFDPRKTTPDGHLRRCRRAIEGGRQLVAREAGVKPVMVAEVVQVDEATAMLERLFVPLPFRGRKLLVGGALALAAESAPVAGKRLLLFASGDAMMAAAEKAQYETVARYRQIVMLG